MSINLLAAIVSGTIGNGRICFYEFDGKKLKEIRSRRIRLPGALTGRVVFYKGKAYIPAGLRGICFE
jgi:hypothetical protein